jgi:DNA-binding MarR family transcriptional regulator
MTITIEQTAQSVLEVTPIVIRVIRAQMRGSRAPVLTVPQFRALLFVDNNTGASLSQVAEHVGLTLPSTSALVTGLVQRRYLNRHVHPDDRRRMTLALTAGGRQMLQTARQNTQAYLARQLAGVSEAERETVLCAMAVLKHIFANAQAG